MIELLGSQGVIDGAIHILFFITLGGMFYGWKKKQKTIDRLTYGALHDALTGLPNKAVFEERLRTALARARRNDFTVAVLHIDLHRFRDINQTLGHQWGDEALRMIARRISSSLREEDTLSRFAADEFCVLLEDAADVTAPARVGERILGQLEKAFNVRGREL